MLIDLAILALGLWGLILVLRLRAVLSLYFPAVEAELLKRETEPPAGTRDLYLQADEELAALGFDSPRWVLCRSRPSEGNPVRLQAVYAHPVLNVQVWLSPPVDINRPNRLLTYLTSRLEDGRWAVTQIRDPYFESVGDAETPAQTVATESLEKALKLHRRWRADLGSPVDGSMPIARLIEQFAGEWQMKIRERLAADGRICIVDGQGRPGLRFAWQILGRLKKLAAASTPTEPVPAGRLALLAGLVEQVTRRQPSAFHERLLFGLSAVLFVLIGTPFFGAELTLVLLLVIVFHELGHWVAMRAFGYHNPHITLLPLLGGVTMGHENDPDPAKRAWVSLAGPLPGILVGWGLGIAYAMAGGDGWPDGSLMAIGVLLFVNYFNVLPIPPLDGSHVLRALLPPRWVVVQIIVLLLGVAFAVWLGWWFDLWILAGLALLQLVTVPGQWRLFRAVRELAGSLPPPQRPKPERVRAALEGLEALYGPASQARPRIDQAREVVTLLSTRSMSMLHRLVISAVFLVLLAVPVGGAVMYAELSTSFSGGMDSEAMEAMIAREEAQRQQWASEAEGLEWTELVTSLQAEEDRAPPAALSAIEEAEDRLGRLPEGLAALYTITNGLPGLGLGPVETIQRVADSPAAQEFLEYGVYDGAHHFYLPDNDVAITVAPAQTQDWWSLSGETSDMMLFWAPEGVAGTEHRLVVYFLESPSLHTDIPAYLREAWVGERQVEDAMARSEVARARRAAEIQGLGVLELVAELPEPTLLERMIADVPTRPAGASESDLQALEQRLAIGLDPGHRRLLSTHDGLPSLNLLGTAQVRGFDPASDTEPGLLEHWLEAGFETEGFEALSRMSGAELSNCWVVGGFDTSSWEGQDGGIRPHLLWCPQWEGRFVDLHRQRAHADFEAFLRAAVVDRTTAWE